MRCAFIKHFGGALHVAQGEVGFLNDAAMCIRVVLGCLACVLARYYAACTSWTWCMHEAALNADLQAVDMDITAGFRAIGLETLLWTVARIISACLVDVETPLTPACLQVRQSRMCEGADVLWRECVA